MANRLHIFDAGKYFFDSGLRLPGNAFGKRAERVVKELSHKVLARLWPRLEIDLIQDTPSEQHLRYCETTSNLIFQAFINHPSVEAFGYLLE